jgi:epoxide hydrolase-like predicted phosphatase
LRHLPAFHTKIGMSIQAVIFDFGNVLAFFDHHRATRQLALRSQWTEEEIFQAIYTTELEDALESGRLSTPRFLEHLRERCTIEGSDEVLGELFGDIFTGNPEVCSLIPRLKPRYRLVLGSNCTALHSDRFLRQFADTLSHFDGVVLSHEIGVRKPRAGFYEECVRRANCRPEECVFIDDLTANVAGAVAVGIPGIVYRHPDDLPAKLCELGIIV